MRGRVRCAPWWVAWSSSTTVIATNATEVKKIRSIIRTVPTRFVTKRQGSPRRGISGGFLDRQLGTSANQTIQLAQSRHPIKPPSVKLPNRLQRMVGRADTVAALSEKLLASRFVTIVGPGGEIPIFGASPVRRNFGRNQFHHINRTPAAPRMPSRLPPSVSPTESW